MALPLIAAALAAYGAYDANRRSQASARETTAANQAMAREQMKFQERMSNTAHTRAREDLQRAGINPLLAGTNAASTPTGAAGTGVANKFDDIVTPSLSSAIQTKQLGLAMDKQKEEVDLLKAQTKKTKVDTAAATKNIPEADLKNSVYNWVKKTFGEAPSNSAKAADEYSRRVEMRKKIREQEELNRRHKLKQQNKKRVEEASDLYMHMP